MYYFEHYLRAGGVADVATVAIRRPEAARGIVADLRAELLDLWPLATVRELAEGEAAGPCDLLIAVFATPYRFPFHDVVYEHLAELRSLLDGARTATHVMLYRAAWREVEVVPASRLRRRYLRLRIEHALIRRCRASRVLRRLLRPLF